MNTINFAGSTAPCKSGTTHGHYPGSGMAYGLHTELELAKVRGPAWLRAAVWEGLEALRKRHGAGAPDLVRDPTGEEQDALWLDVGRWMEAVQAREPDLAPEDEPRVRAAFAELLEHAERWPAAPDALWPHLRGRAPAPTAEAPEAPRFTGTGGERPGEVGMMERRRQLAHLGLRKAYRALGVEDPALKRAREQRAQGGEQTGEGET